MDPDEIKQLMAAFAASDLGEMTLARGDWTLRLARAAGEACADTPEVTTRAKRAGALRPGPAPAPAMGAGDVRAPLAGIVYLNPAPDAPAFVTVGARVEAGDVVAVIEAMKVFNEIRAERAGTVEAIEVVSGAEVEAGQSLLRIG